MRWVTSRPELHPRASAPPDSAGCSIESFADAVAARSASASTKAFFQRSEIVGRPGNGTGYLHAERDGRSSYLRRECRRIRPARQLHPAGTASIAEDARNVPACPAASTCSSPSRSRHLPRQVFAQHLCRALPWRDNFRGDIFAFGVVIFSSASDGERRPSSQRPGPPGLAGRL